MKKKRFKVKDFGLTGIGFVFLLRDLKLMTPEQAKTIMYRASYGYYKEDK